MKNRLVAFLVLCLSFLMIGCSKKPLEERLWNEPKHCLIFSYDDFGPSVLTYTSLGQPDLTNGPRGEKKNTKDQIRIVVTVSGYSISAQRVMHERAGRHEKGYEYRYVNYFNALVVLDGVLAEPRLTEEYRRKVTDTKSKILKEMGDEDQARKVDNDLMEEIREASRAIDEDALDKAREFQIEAGPGV